MRSLIARTALAIAATATVASAQVEVFSVLTSDQEVGPAANSSGSNGVGFVEIDFDGNGVDAEITAEFNLQVNDGTEITRIHIHNAPAGQNAGVVVFFFDVIAGLDPAAIPVPEGGQIELEFTTTIDASLAQQLIDTPDQFYFNVHTDAVPAGETRGQLGNVASEELIPSRLTSDQEVGAAANSSQSRGNAEAEISFEEGIAEIEVDMRLFINQGTEITRIHIHNAPAGSNGGVVVFFFDVIAGLDPTAIPVPVGGQLDLSFETEIPAPLALDIATNPDQYYFNVHTNAVPAGETRGQLGNFPTAFPRADLNRDGIVSYADVDEFVARFFEER
ncbi:MAG: CHRD domain-containing protein [Planctomycetota bacterium]